MLTNTLPLMFNVNLFLYVIAFFLFLVREIGELFLEHAGILIRFELRVVLSRMVDSFDPRLVAMLFRSRLVPCRSGTGLGSFVHRLHLSFGFICALALFGLSALWSYLDSVIWALPHFSPGRCC
jgi:hypothetical protein